MKIDDILTENLMYTAYLLDAQTRQSLLQQFPPKYSKVIAHHITVQYPVADDALQPPSAEIKVVGYADSGDGLEALVVSVDGKIQRPDGGTYHITWSLDPIKYEPKDSNALVSSQTKKFLIKLPILISATPSLLK